VNDAGISVYPNPSNGNFIIEWQNDFNSDGVAIEVVNAVGKKVFSSQGKILSSSRQKEIDLNEAASGVYFIEIKSDAFSLRKKIILSR